MTEPTGFPRPPSPSSPSPTPWANENVHRIIRTLAAVVATLALVAGCGALNTMATQSENQTCAQVQHAVAEGWGTYALAGGFQGRAESRALSVIDRVREDCLGLELAD